MDHREVLLQRKIITNNYPVAMRTSEGADFQNFGPIPQNRRLLTKKRSSSGHLFTHILKKMVLLDFARRHTKFCEKKWFPCLKYEDLLWCC
jgi:hypothetical protein